MKTPDFTMQPYENRQSKNLTHYSISMKSTKAVRRLRDSLMRLQIKQRLGDEIVTEEGREGVPAVGADLDVAHAANIT